MSDGPTFEAYLASKKIDSEAFSKAEPDVWRAWKMEFGQMHANSFTVQKLNLINLIRRKYLLVSSEAPKEPAAAPTVTTSPAAASKPGRPVIRPKRD